MFDDWERGVGSKLDGSRTVEEAQEVELQRKLLGLEMRVSRGLGEWFGNDAHVEAFLDHIAEQVVLQVKQEVYGENLQRYEVTYASTWWEAFKERWFPAWLKRQVGVRKTTVVMDATALYPTLSVSQHQHHIHMAVNRREYNAYGTDDELGL